MFQIVILITGGSTPNSLHASVQHCKSNLDQCVVESVGGAYRVTGRSGTEVSGRAVAAQCEAAWGVRAIVESVTTASLLDSARPPVPEAQSSAPVAVTAVTGDGWSPLTPEQIEASKTVVPLYGDERDAETEATAEVPASAPEAIQAPSSASAYTGPHTAVVFNGAAWEELVAASRAYVAASNGTVLLGEPPFVQHGDELVLHAACARETCEAVDYEAPVGVSVSFTVWF